MSDSWQQIRNILENGLNPSLFALWIKPLTALVDGTTLTLTAPNAFVASWVRDKLSATIQEVAAQVLGVSPRIVVQAARSAPRPKQPAPAKPVSSKSRGQATQAAPLGLPLDVAEAGVRTNRNAPNPAWRYCFEDFVVGPCNDLAFAAAQGVTRETFRTDQLYICSAAGLGKTHLIQAIGHAALLDSNKASLSVRYLTAEEFATKMILALKAGDMTRFKAKFRDRVDLLLLEDVHFLQGKAKIQDELLATIKSLRDRGGRVVYTSSFLPKELSAVDDHLLSRFCSGVLAFMDKPDFDTRRRIIERKASRLQVDVPIEVGEYLAERMDGDVRQLESCLQNLILKARLLNCGLNLELAQDVLRHYAPDCDLADLERIVRAVCRAFTLTPTQLASKSRKRQVVTARNTAFFLARRHTDLSLKDIGLRFNRRHSTVIKGITNLEREMSKRTPEGRRIKRTLELINQLD